MAEEKAIEKKPLRLLTREDVHQQDQLRHEDVPTPEFGEGTGVRIQELTADERDVFESATIKIRREVIQRRGVRATTIDQDFVEEALHNMRARLVAASARNEDGSLMFSEDDVIWLGKRSAAVMDRLYAVASALCGLTEDDVKQLMKGLAKAPNGASPSDSH